MTKSNNNGGKAFNFICKVCNRMSQSKRNQVTCFSCSAKKGGQFRDKPDLTAAQLEERMAEIVANETRMPWER